jgi:uncharacterized membrane protein
MSRKNDNFWTGFGVGAAAGAISVLLPQLIGSGGHSRVIRLEKSIQIGRPVEDVYGAWVDWDRLPRLSNHIADIRHNGTRSHWRLQVDGQYIEWDAIIEQLIPNQAIGWKSITGPKHTGRIAFSPIGEDTLVHVTMNYAPPSRVLRPLVAPWSEHIEGLIEKVLREFKASVESRPRGAQGVRSSADQGGPGTNMTELPRTGTFGDQPRKIEPRFGGTVNPVDYSRPPEAKS